MPSILPKKRIKKEGKNERGNARVRMQKLLRDSFVSLICIGQTGKVGWKNLALFHEHRSMRD